VFAGMSRTKCVTSLLGRTSWHPDGMPEVYNDCRVAISESGRIDDSPYLT
jgi:hypothetical protein